MKKSEIVLAIVLVLSVFIILSSRIGSSHFLTVLSGSMCPTINMGDLVIVNPTNPESIKVNDIIAFMNGDKKVPTTHRVIEITDQGFKTKGDANEDPDPRIVKPNEVLGKVAFNIPYAGYFVHYARSKLGFLFLVLIPGIIIIISEVRSIMKYRKKKSKREQKTYVFSLLLILVSSMTVMSTKAYFSDTETSVGNTFTAWVAPAVPAKVSIEPIDDSFVRSNKPNRNYGDKKIIMVMDIKDKIIDYGFLKFDLSELPDDADISSAEVYMYGLGVSFEKGFDSSFPRNFKHPDKGLKPADVSMLFVQDDSWDEDTITWQNKPSAEDVLGTESVRKPGWYSWDVTSKTREEFKSDKKLSLMLSIDSGIAIFFSKESKRKPYLLIEYTSANPVNNEEPTNEEDSNIEDIFIQELQDISWGNTENENATESSGGGSGNIGFPGQTTDNNTTQNCTEVWNCTEWSLCINGTQMRNCTDINDCNTTLDKPPVIQECDVTNNTTYNCTEDWVCTEWSPCVNGTQTRNCTDTNNCSTVLDKPIEFQECNVTDNRTQCIEDWSCTDWSECINGTQIRICTDMNECNTTFFNPNESQECNSTEENMTECTEDWTCSDWTECLNETQSRTCNDLNECNTTLNKPTENQECNITTTTTTSTTTTTTIPENETSND